MTHIGKVFHLLPDRHLSELVQSFLPGTAERRSLENDKGTRKKSNRLIYRTFLNKQAREVGKIYELQITVEVIHRYLASWQRRSNPAPPVLLVQHITAMLPINTGILWGKGNNVFWCKTSHYNFSKGTAGEG